MSTSSYNLLKAAADGLADAINYRTNLKRKRREEEYNYNRDWQRNENEYQRDLGRKRDELDYMTDYNWKQQQKAHDRQIEWENQAREDKIAQRLDFIDKYNPANVNRFDYNDVITHNMYNDVYDMPFAVKHEKSPEQIQKELEKKLELEFEYANKKGQADLSRQKALVDYRNAQKTPRDTRPNQQRLAEWYMGLTPEQREQVDKVLKINGMPKAVKGSGSKSVAVGGSGYDKELNDLIKEYIKARGEEAKARGDSANKGNVDFAQKRVDINPELPEEQIAEMEGAIQADQAHFNKSMTDSLRNYENRSELLRYRINELLKSSGRRINEQGIMEDIIGTKKNNISSIVSEDDDILGDIESRNPQLARSIVSTLYSDNTQPTGVFLPDTMPQSIPIPINNQYVNPNIFKPLPKNSYQYK